MRRTNSNDMNNKNASTENIFRIESVLERQLIDLALKMKKKELKI